MAKESGPRNELKQALHGTVTTLVPHEPTGQTGPDTEPGWVSRLAHWIATQSGALEIGRASCRERVSSEV